ncbi:KH domain protein [Dictyocaulus viviparus]|uniref:KH domain protein n=1 Tax=Dictyocaulus viviparus TaxID=29172 RepID=A0A0D8XGE0_DICVI|nr:KH domain protein [Dictyocaulus viviparus]
MTSDDVVVLQNGRYEEKIQVDRRRLEAMIAGAPVGETAFIFINANDFFTKVEQYSGAQICWPSHLKIGAKTKKDPFVKVIGTVDAIERAKHYISTTLRARNDRVTLKMDIHHSIHSHIIGKGGKSIQQIMRTTGCHIHFPDSNKYA